MADVALIDPKMAYQQHQDNAWREKVCATGLKSTALHCPEEIQTRPYLVKGLIAQQSLEIRLIESHITNVAITKFA